MFTSGVAWATDPFAALAAASSNNSNSNPKQRFSKDEALNQFGFVSPL